MEPNMEQTFEEHELWRAITDQPENALDVVRAALATGVDLSKDAPEEFFYGGSVKEGMSALFVAVSLKAIGIVGLLIDAGAKARDAGETGDMFYVCVQNGDAVMLHCLLTRGVIDNGGDGFVMDLMHSISRRYSKDSVDLLRVCLEYAIVCREPLSAILAHIDSIGNTLLHDAVSSYDPKNRCETCHVHTPRVRGGHDHSLRAPVVKLLIAYGANVLLTDERGHTPAYIAKQSADQDPEVQDILEQQTLNLQKLESFAMGHHPRLGIESMMNRVAPEVLRMICERGRL
jgi:hypothetical protein